MPSVYLSPSTQEYNPYITGGTEEYYMNLIADAVEPYLTASGIQYSRNTPSMTAGSSLREANRGNYDLYVAMHSNAAPPSLSGQLTGTDVYYSRGSANGRRAAEIFAENLKAVYPQPLKVQARPTATISEVTKTIAPAVLIEYAYHDNPQDAEWIINNIGPIARATARAITQYFGLPLIEPQQARQGRVKISSGHLNIRSAPSAGAPIIGRAYNGDAISVLGRSGDWYSVNYNGLEGYANAAYISLQN